MNAAFFLSCLLCAAVLGVSSCARSADPGALVVVQTPLASKSFVPSHDLIDTRYPVGSRIILAGASLQSKRIRLLSRGLDAAGGPIVSYDGQRAIFCGKKSSDGDWQIYVVQIPNGTPEVLTSMPGGAMQPALLPDNRIVFASPVPRLDTPAETRAQIPQLYVQSFGAAAHQLTFGPSGATDPTVLLDGRILFVASQPSSDNEPSAGQALYTINNDGTELMPFAGQHEGASIIEQPGQLPDGRVAFLERDLQTSAVPQPTFEFVNLARPFFGHQQLFRAVSFFVRSVRSSSSGDLLVCAEPSTTPSSIRSTSAVFRVAHREIDPTRLFSILSDKTESQIGSRASDFTTPIFSDPNWNALDAIEAFPHPRPMGRLSNMDPAKHTGQILCLNANNTTICRGTNGTAPMATRVRVLAGGASGAACVLGEVLVQADGSFMAEVPSDVPLGFEALNEDGQVLRRVAPIVWVRPGENRSCIGCHEPHNHAPHNHRPLAVRAPVPYLGIEANKSASEHSNNSQTDAFLSPRDVTKPPNEPNLVTHSCGIALKPGI